MSHKTNLIEYWNIPQVLAEQQGPLGQELAVLVAEKIQRLHGYYEKATEKQRDVLNKDVALMGKYAEMIDFLVMQVSGLARDYVDLCEKQTELIHENNRLKSNGLDLIAKELKAMNNDLKASRSLV